MSTYLVTGGCGFIGSHLVDTLLAAGHRVRVLDNLSTGKIDNLARSAYLIIGDVADPQLVARALEAVDGCYHLAAVASTQRANEAWLATHRSNLEGTICILDAARRWRLPVVFASSAAVYGEHASGLIREHATLRPIGAYGADKLGSELHARVASLVHGVPTLGFRFFNVYGPRQHPNSPYSGVVSIFVDRLLQGGTIEVHGDGQQVRDFIHVRDIVRFLTEGMARTSLDPRVFNACTGIATSVQTLARTIGHLCGAEVKMRFLPARPGDIRRSVGSPELATRQLSVQARISLAEGLDETIRSLARQRNAA
jgi:UDP-glucose 4-epimerase